MDFLTKMVLREKLWRQKDVLFYIFLKKFPLKV